MTHDKAAAGHHPEDICTDCGGPNVVWHAPNDLWNRVMGGEGGILCPRCFIQRAKADGINEVWRVDTAAMAGEHGELVGRLRAIVDAFDDDVANELASDSGERADLWEETDVPVELLRHAAAALSAADAEIERQGQSNANLFNVISAIRWKSGVGVKPMLGELADAIAAVNHRARTAEAKVAELLAAVDFIVTSNMTTPHDFRQVARAAAIRAREG